ncbi:MAG: methionine synthase [Dehalococcoidaceae bacterium]|nr:methionine synthase [Dehalococcoidaceae bacterium]
MSLFNFAFKTTIIGSMPHTDPEKACQLIKRYLKDIPAWPQLPRRSLLELMDAQFSRGFPGLEITEGKLSFKRSAGFEKALESLYENYLADKYAMYAVTPDYAAGLHYFTNMAGFSPPAVKGQILGPVSWCLSIADESGKSILYDDILSDAASRMLALSARWQEDLLGRVSKNTLLFIDEPAMSSYGSAFLSLPGEKLAGLIRETMSRLRGLKGIHCCGNTDWGLVLSTGADVLSLDAYQHGTTLSLYPEAVAAHLARGGAVAWGIVPNTEAAIAGETVAALKDRLEETMGALARSGIAFRELAQASLLTPSCSLSGLSEEGAEQALALMAELSERMISLYL